MQKDAAKKLEMLLCEPQLIEPTGSEVYEAVLFCFFFKKTVTYTTHCFVLRVDPIISIGLLFICISTAFVICAQSKATVQKR